MGRAERSAYLRRHSGFDASHRPGMTKRFVVARSVSDEAIQFLSRCSVDCFAEPVIGRRFAPTRWLAMTRRMRYFPTHFGGRFSENAFGPSI
jgi:hypothetical protein